MQHIDALAKAIAKKHPCDACHKALESLKQDITALIDAWNNLPDSMTTSDALNDLSEVVKRIGGV